ncbi:NADP-dependent oxidoreductase [Micromonospora sp. NPDC023633]|uniref:NADP-dependent oxidoreductase n=1 Tax=Micromonospora sp. NPDC023633 TaxID=3154320 RepID=UPI0033D878CA
MTSSSGRAPYRMLAVSQDVAGPPDVLKIIEMARPVPALGEILVRVHAAGVNPTDWKTRARGQFATGALPPFVLGFDVSGVVEEVGPGVTLFAAGDEVFGMPRFPHPAGAYAEFVTAPARHFCRKPANIDHTTAAALPLASLTAWQALVDTADIQPGQRVLVHAAAGGVGHLAVQIAKARGAWVIGTARAGKHDLLRGLGADELIDYTTDDFGVVLRDLDVVLDTIGGDYTPRSLRTLRRGGILVSLLPVAPDFPADLAEELSVRATRLLVEPDHAGMRAVADLVARGQLRPLVDTTLPLKEAARAHERGETNSTTGKIVLSVIA